MYTKQLVVAGLPSQLHVVVDEKETTLDLMVYPFLSGSSSPSAKLVIRRARGNGSATYDTIFKGSNAEFSGVRAGMYLKACNAAMEQCLQWQAIAESLNDSPSTTARELVSMAEEGRLEDLLRYTTLIGDPLVEMQSTGYNYGKKPTAQSWHLANVFFRDPAFNTAKEVFFKLTNSEDYWDIQELSKDDQCHILTMYALLNKLPMCSIGSDESKLIAALLLERGDVPFYIPQLKRVDPFFLGANGDKISHADYVKELMATRPNLQGE